MILKISRNVLFVALLVTAVAPANAAKHRKTAVTHHESAAAHHKKKHAAAVAEKPVPEVLSPEASRGIPQTRAASVLVTEANDGHLLYEKNADERRPVASTQKLLTALIIAEAGDLDKEVTVEISDTWAEPVVAHIKPGEVYTRRNLLQVLLVHSTNDVARCLARDNAGSVEAFADKMNEKARELEMNHSHFVNPNGLPAQDQFSTARDMAKLARAAYQSRTIRSIVSMKSVAFHYASGRVTEFKNTNRVLRGYAPCNGMKTGFTDAARHCLISSGSNNGRDVIVVVLGDNQRVWQDSCSLLAWGLSM